MKLYEIPQGSVIKGIEVRDKADVLLGDVVVFDHLDGMYTYCYVEGTNPKVVVHLFAGTPVKKVGDHYEVEE